MLTVLALACHNYENEHGKLPPAVVYGSDGKALYSWRVLILPYVEQRELFEKFHKDEPWDSPHNIHLLAAMPEVYAPPPRKSHLVPPNHTICQVFVGKGTPFEKDVRVKIRDDFPDGTSNTLLIVEAGTPVPWSRPADIVFDPNQPIELHGLFPDGIRTCLADCSRRWIKSNTSQATWRAAITRNGGEPMGDDWIR